MAKADAFSSNFGRLAAFRAVAFHRNLNAAAMSLGLTGPAVSIQVKKLETEMGVALFNHLPNRLVLTERGEAFFKEVDDVFKALDRATATAKGSLDQFQGRATVALSKDIATVFAPSIAAFIKEHPKINISILSRASNVGMNLIVNGEADVAVGFYGKVPRTVAKTVIAKTNLCLFYPAGHPLDRRVTPSLREIAAHRVIMLRQSSTTGRMISAPFTGKKGGIENVLEAGSCSAAMEFAQLGLGIAIVHGICAKAGADDRSRIVDASGHFGITDVAVLTRRNAILTPAQTALIRHLSKRLAD